MLAHGSIQIYVCHRNFTFYHNLLAIHAGMRNKPEAFYLELFCVCSLLTILNFSYTSHLT